MKKILFILGYLFTAGIITGFLFILLHLPGGSMLLNYGTIGFSLIFIPYYSLRILKQKVEEKTGSTRIYSGIASSVIIGISVLMKMNHLMGADIALALGIGILTILFTPLTFIRLFKLSENKKATS